MKINVAEILYCEQKAKVACDRKCSKAWGISQRPKVQLSDDEDDYAFRADCELGQAPANPGTYEGGEGKPLSPDEFPTKWCVRECERCSMTSPGESDSICLEIKTFETRQYNKGQAGKEHL